MPKLSAEMVGKTVSAAQLILTLGEILLGGLRKGDLALGIDIDLADPRGSRHL